MQKNNLKPILLFLLLNYLLEEIFLFSKKETLYPITNLGIIIKPIIHIPLSLLALSFLYIAVVKIQGKQINFFVAFLTILKLNTVIIAITILMSLINKI